jgi:2'-5' RNA ligase
MNAIVAMLDPTHERRVYDLWEELETTFDVRGVYVTPYPHFTLQGALHYDLDRLPNMLEQIAATSEAFAVETTGLGIFTGDSPVLFIPVKRTPALNRVHERIWQVIQPLTTDLSHLYHATNWIPHITIGFGDVQPDKLAAITTFLAERDFDWEIQVNSLAFIHHMGDAQLLKFRSRFGGTE